MVSQSKWNAARTWIRAESGETYICQIDAIEGIDNPTEADYQRLCVRESDNPQNN
jgi:hypothetical protein